MFAGYMMWKTGDYGLNPEHPPLAKLLATLPLVREPLWIPPLQDRDFKIEAFLDGHDWLARNDGAAQRLVFRMRLATLPLALGLSVFVFLAAWEWFGPTAALIALTLVVFDPNIVAHSGLVTTDAGVTCFFLASIYAFYRYIDKPRLDRLLLAGLAVGLLLATKHSGILIGPMLVLLAAYEVWRTPRDSRKSQAVRMVGALAGIVVLSVAVLWAFYGFRYAARPAPLQLSTSLVDYTAPLGEFSRGVVLWFAHWHLLPESYLMGLVDVKRMADFYPTFILGQVHAKGVWWYFPIVLLIKTTLGMLALAALACLAIWRREIKNLRAVVYIAIPFAVYLFVAMASGMNIGARHILPLYAMLAIFIGSGVSALVGVAEDQQAASQTIHANKKWAWVCGVLVVAHIASALTVFPYGIAYANEAWGGPTKVHNLLSDANVDWAQQLIQVKQWQDRHPNEECWFAYFAYPEIDPGMYGIRCHHLPTLVTIWLGVAEPIPPVVNGTVLISAGELSGCEWPSGKLNPYRNFQSRKPDETIDYGVFVYHGSFAVPEIASASLAQVAMKLGTEGKMQEAFEAAQSAVRLDPGSVIAQTELGDTATKVGNPALARTAYTAALAAAHELAPDAQVSYVPGLEAKLK